VRDGHLHVFLPPTRKLEHYLELIGAIESTAKSLAVPVVLEGYEPPHDHRLEHVEWIAGAMRAALDELAALGGRMTPDDVIGRVFATFCVGK